MAKRIGVVDYGVNNLLSVCHAIDTLGAVAEPVTDARRLAACEWVILPGVGTVAAAMARLTQSGLADALRERADKQRPLLGVCLGMQLLFESSEESPGVRALGILPGVVKRIPGNIGVKVPHMGWNTLRVLRDNPLLDVGQTPSAYFVHSYYAAPAQERMVAAVSDYGFPVTAVVASGVILGTQFHPEKSGADGIEMLRRFIMMDREEWLC